MFRTVNMKYCKLHDHKAYSKTRANEIIKKSECNKQGFYVAVDKKIRIYCFNGGAKC